MATLKQLSSICFFTLFILFISNTLKAQPQKGEFIKASIGSGFSAPYDNTNLMGTGFYVQGEYIFAPKKWFGLRPYAGYISTNTNNNQGYKVDSKSFLIGGKARVVAPIPWFAPYFELGVGASIGSFETYTPSTYIKKNGIITHIPFSIGVALGRKHNFDLAFTYYYQNAVEQFSGATAIGFTFPIN